MIDNVWLPCAWNIRQMESAMALPDLSTAICTPVWCIICQKKTTIAHGYDARNG